MINEYNNGYTLQELLKNKEGFEYTYFLECLLTDMDIEKHKDNLKARILEMSNEKTVGLISEELGLPRDTVLKYIREK